MDSPTITHETFKIAKDAGFPVDTVEVKNDVHMEFSPTQVEVQTWLREEKGIHAGVEPYVKNYSVVYQTSLARELNRDSEDIEIVYLNGVKHLRIADYNLAMEKSIQEGLKLLAEKEQST